MASMIQFGKWIVIIIVFGIPALVQAEFYKYIDKDGNVQFTDNLTNVPADQRKQVDEYEEVVPSRRTLESVEADQEREAVGPKDVGKKKGQDQEDEVEVEEKDASASNNEHSLAEQQLREAEEQLRTEYEALMKEREAIEQTASQRLTPRLRRRLQEDTDNFDKRIKDFERRREAHNKAVEAHNARIEQQGRDSQGEGPAQ